MFIYWLIDFYLDFFCHLIWDVQDFFGTIWFIWKLIIMHFLRISDNKISENIKSRMF